MTDKIDQLWTGKLEPMLAAKQIEFTTLRDQNRKRGLIGLGGGLGVAILIILIFNPASVVVLLLLTVAVGLGVAGWLHGSTGIMGLSSDIKRDVLSKLAHHLNLDYAPTSDMSGSVDRFQRMGLLPKDDPDLSKNGWSLEDRFTSRLAGVDFEMFVAKSEQLIWVTTSNDEGADTEKEEWKILFQGVAIRGRFPNKLNGSTIVREYKDLTNLPGLLSKKSIEIAGRTLESIELVEKKMDDRKYASYGDDQPAVRELLTPEFVAQLNALKDALGGTGMEIAFGSNEDSNEFLLVIPTAGGFEVGTRTKPVPTRESFDGVVKRLRLIMDIAEQVSPTGTAAKDDLAKPIVDTASIPGAPAATKMDTSKTSGQTRNVKSKGFF
jgi:hypothetical protein